MTLPIIGSTWWHWHTGERVIVQQLSTCTCTDNPSEYAYVTIMPRPPATRLENGNPEATLTLPRFINMYVPMSACAVWEENDKRDREAGI